MEKYRMSKLPVISGRHIRKSANSRQKTVRLRKDMDSVEGITDITIKKQVKQKAEGSSIG